MDEHQISKDRTTVHNYLLWKQGRIELYSDTTRFIAEISSIHAETLIGAHFSSPNAAWNPEYDSENFKREIAEAVQSRFEQLKWSNDATQEINNLLELAKTANEAYNAPF